MRIANHVDIEAPVDTVFRWITHKNRIVQWIPNLLKSRITRETAGRIGTRLRQVYDVNHRRVEVPIEVTAYEPNRRLTVRMRTRKQDTVIDFRLEELRSATRLTRVAHIRFVGYMKLVGLLTGESVRDRSLRSCQQQFDRLKRLCQQEAGTR